MRKSAGTGPSTKTRKTTPSASKPSARRRDAKRTVVKKSGLEPGPTTGWLTSDADEIALRRWRGSTDIAAIESVDSSQDFFGLFRAQSSNGNVYDVEIRNLAGLTNTCACVDHKVNGLGTCKHIEGTLAALGKGRRRAFREAARAGSPWIEVFLDAASGRTPVVAWPARADDPDLSAARAWMEPWLNSDGTLDEKPDRIEALLKAWPQAPAAAKTSIRLSRHLVSWLDASDRRRSRLMARAAFEADVAAGRDTVDVLRHSLLPYQRIGAIHLAFGERALLADDMGLGKTIQAIAACELLARRRGIERVLIVCPASLKAEWEEQIARFSTRSTHLVFGPRKQRIEAYRAPVFFTIVNYEQVVSDANELDAVLKPEIVVLDEAQRIKNWQTKTARCVKSLRAPYAFVLTGTPVENRIDELYSIIQYLDPDILGPLFRFNRDFYELDERGRPVDYKNLATLRERIAPVMLRRRKSDVEHELPGRTVKTFFVPMADEQKARYEDYRGPVAQLMARAKTRPLRKEEFDRLQQLLGCMRMVCDTPAILDPSCRVCPKLEELEGILDDLLAEPDRKVIIFSEWERMLTMVRDLAGDIGVDVAWHTGSVPQNRRRAEINRFKHDPACRLFLSTDSGSVGLNLQVASAVINMDLPWNPAKLEQRIARAWRKNQTRSVSVVNLVTQDSIEHSILHLLGQKQALADGIIDGDGDLDALKMPSGRGAFLERVQAMMAPLPVPRVVSAEDAMAADTLARLGTAVLLIESRKRDDGTTTILVVLDLEAEALDAERDRTGHMIGTEVIDKQTYLSMQHLVTTGLLRYNAQARTLYRSAALPVAPVSTGISETKASLAIAAAERLLKMANVLASGGFPEEVPALLDKALRHIATVVAGRGGKELVEPVSDDAVRSLIEMASIAPEAAALLDATKTNAVTDGPTARALIAILTRVLAALRQNEPALNTQDALAA